MISFKDLFIRWQLAIKESRLRRKLIKSKDEIALKNLIEFALTHEYEFPIEEVKIRNAILQVDIWKMNDRYQKYIFTAIENHLFNNVNHSLPIEWSFWLKASKRAKRYIDTMNPIVSQALADAKRLDKLSLIDKEEYQYLLSCYLKAYREVLHAAMTSNNHDMLHLLIEFGAIAQLAESDEESIKALRSWALNRPPRPRALTGINDDQALSAPTRGVGSPHRMTVTIFREPSTAVPVRIVYTGTSGDATLNAQLFANLFSTALASDEEPTFVTVNGGVITLNSRIDTRSHQPTENILSAVIGPAGPVQPGPVTPSLGMDINTAISMFIRAGRQFQDDTGLIQLGDSELTIAEQLEEKITETLKSGDPRDRVIRSNSQYNSEDDPENPYIHIMPLLYRASKDQVIPIEIEVPYKILGAEKVFNLLREARQAYMEQLIAAGEKRRLMAEKVFKQEDEAVKNWESYSEEKKNEICSKSPYVWLTIVYDFELGIQRPADEPERISRREFEDTRRPQLRDSASYWAQQIAFLCEKLSEMNKAGGKADILTFKLLVDAMLREAHLLIPDQEFQEEYKNWVEAGSVPLWSVLEDWASKNGLPSIVFASDNVVFNVKVIESQKHIRIQPWVMIDLHDFTVHISGKQGFMAVYSSGKIPSLADSVIGDLEHGITNPRRLHEKFCTWAANFIPQVYSRESQQHDVRTALFSDRKIEALLKLEMAKTSLYKGDFQKAINILKHIRNADLAVIYFWGAVAYQYQFLQKFLAAKFDSQQIVALSIGSLMGFLKQGYVEQKRLTQIAGRIKYSTLSELQRSNFTVEMIQSLVDKEADKFLRQLQARDRTFVEGLLLENLSFQEIFELEQKSLGLELTSAEQNKLNAAKLAWSSLEGISLADLMRNTAYTLSFQGKTNIKLREDIDSLLEMAQSITFQTPSVLDLIGQLQELAKHFEIGFVVADLVDE